MKNRIKYTAFTVLSIMSIVVGDAVTAQHFWLIKENYSSSRG